MSRTRLRQVEQIENSSVYDDGLNQGNGSVASTEGQPGNNVGSNNAILSTTTTTIVVTQNLVSLGVNVDDVVTISGSTSNNGTYRITAISFSTNTTMTVETTSLDGLVNLSASTNDGNAQAKVNPSKSLERDLNHIRTQLRKLNGTDDWFDNPSNLPVNAFFSSTGVAGPAGTILDVGANFEAGTPFELSVYLNGNLLNPSVISGNTITDQYDYQEMDSEENLVEVGDIGRKIQINFDILSGDIFQFVWSR
jgi:hypothetical protein